MRRSVTSIITLACVVAALGFALPGAAVAQADESLAGHPLVGTWLIAEEETPDDPFMVIFSSDGTAIQTEGAASSTFGVWESTGSTTANVTFRSMIEEEGFAGVVTIRAAFEVAPDGMSLTAEYTAQFVMADGDDQGELGPGAVVGNRMLVEPMGTPVGPLFEEATPAP